ncbi:hypothetical protein Dimus_013330, partial [Dionaea muscipula]
MELTDNYNTSQDFVRRLEGSLMKAKKQSTSRLTTLEKAQSRCEELKRKIERLEKSIIELEQQRPSSMDEMVELWQASEEGKAAIVLVDKKWDGLPWPHDDIGVTDQNIPYYIANGSLPPIVIDAEEEGESGE